jgi:Uncharacterised nucleotidyltransferase
MAIPSTAPACGGSWPAPSLSAWALQHLAAGVVLEVAARCERAALPVLAVKGVVTSRFLYGDVAERPLTDVDVRIRGADLQRFARVAAAAGWPRLRILRTYRSLTYDFGALSLDVEACVGPPGLCRLDVDTMLRRSERREIAPGRHVLVPEIHDHAVLLTVNAFKDKIAAAPAWAIADLERVVAHRAFGRDEFVARVVEARISTLAWIVAFWMESARGSEGWGAIRVAIESRGHVRSDYARRFQRQMAHASQDRPSMSLRLLARAAADSPFMRMRALVTAVACSAEIRARAAVDALL